GGGRRNCRRRADRGRAGLASAEAGPRRASPHRRWHVRPLHCRRPADRRDTAAGRAVGAVLPPAPAGDRKPAADANADLVGIGIRDRNSGLATTAFAADDSRASLETKPAITPHMGPPSRPDASFVE